MKIYPKETVADPKKASGDRRPAAPFLRALALIVAFVSVFAFFFKILFF